MGQMSHLCDLQPHAHFVATPVARQPVPAGLSPQTVQVVRPVQPLSVQAQPDSVAVRAVVLVEHQAHVLQPQSARPNQHRLTMKNYCPLRE